MLEGLLAGIVGGTIVAVAQHYLVWHEQQQFQIKKSVFDDAVGALTMYEADAMNMELQASNVGVGDVRPETKFREPTNISMAKALALVPAFFSPKTAHAYMIAYGAKLSLKNIPNSDYYERRDKAVRLLAAELRPPHHSVFAHFFGKEREPKRL
jgi:hypothetical protein